MNDFLSFLGEIMARVLLVMLVFQNPSTATPIMAVDGEYGISTQEVRVAERVCIIKIDKKSSIWKAELAFRNELKEEKLLVVDLTTEGLLPRLVFEQKFIDRKNKFLVPCLRADFTPDSQAIKDAWELLHAPEQIKKTKGKKKK